jgi:hypothetical protein
LKQTQHNLSLCRQTLTKRKKRICDNVKLQSEVFKHTICISLA